MLLEFCYLLLMDYMVVIHELVSPLTFLTLKHNAAKWGSITILQISLKEHWQTYSIMMKAYGININHYYSLNNIFNHK